jgi:hypothetical protein
MTKWIATSDDPSGPLRVRLGPFKASTALPLFRREPTSCPRSNHVADVPNSRHSPTSFDHLVGA